MSSVSRDKRGSRNRLALMVSECEFHQPIGCLYELHEFVGDSANGPTLIIP